MLTLTCQRVSVQLPKHRHSAPFEVSLGVTDIHMGWHKHGTEAIGESHNTVKLSGDQGKDYRKSEVAWEVPNSMQVALNCNSNSQP